MKAFSSVSLNACDEHCDCIIVYGSRKCPLCEAEEEKEALEQEVCDLEAIVSDYKQQVAKTKN